MNWLSLTTLMGVMACLWLVMSYNEAHAQQRATGETYTAIARTYAVDPITISRLDRAGA